MTYGIGEDATKARRVVSEEQVPDEQAKAREGQHGGELRPC